jgi:hypothetical protein
VGFWLADDDLPRARAELAYVQQRFPDELPGVQRLWTFIGGVLVDGYSGDPGALWGRLGREWQEYARSHLWGSQWTRVMLYGLRAGAALARLHSDHGESERAGLMRVVENDLDELRSEQTLWATPFVELIHAGMMTLHRQQARAVQGLRAAEQGFRAVDMHLYAAAARRRCGQILGGAAGADIIASADLAMAEQGVRRPDRMTRALAPGFPEAPAPEGA